jgi:putative oxidoreductase
VELSVGALAEKPARGDFSIRQALLHGLFSLHLNRVVWSCANNFWSCAMKIAILIARILLGIVFFGSGVVGLLKLGKMGGMPADATTFLNLMVAHNFTTFVALLMLIGGLLLLVGRFVPIGLVLLGPILVNILLFHLLFRAPGIATGLVCTVLEVFLIWAYRSCFEGLFAAKPKIS